MVKSRQTIDFGTGELYMEAKSRSIDLRFNSVHEYIRDLVNKDLAKKKESDKTEHK
jgi:hypothetical protein